MKTEIYGAYATPIYHVDKVENFNTIQRDITKQYDKAEWYTNEDWGFTHYLSKPGFSGNLVPKIKSLENTIHYHLAQYINQIGFPESPYYYPNMKYRIVNSWFAKFEKHCYAHVHNHGHADVSGAYYFKVPENAADFFINATVPQFDASLLFHQLGFRNYFPLEEGSLMLMPGFVNHGVQTTMDDNVRCSVAFNIIFERQDVNDPELFASADDKP